MQDFSDGDPGTDGVIPDEDLRSVRVEDLNDFGRRLMKRMFMLAGVLLVVLLLIGWTGDRRSCQRQIPVRVESRIRQRVLRDFLQTAAIARREAASHETGALRDDDLRTAAQYDRDRLSLHTLPIPSCSGPFPAVD